ncbi:MAG: hypothetical protein IJ812_06390 [Schwartzia sp.]|nr:hypothetical protein [Schwartzia sp. (in: firmicutes)]
MKAWRKTGAALAAALMLLGAQPALAARGLAEDEVAAAKMQANKLVPKKRVDFAYRSHAESHITTTAGKDNEGFEAEAYLLTPYCYVMSLQLAQGRTGRADFAALGTAAQSYQLRLRLTGRGFDRSALQELKISVRQGTLRELTPTARRYTTIQRIKGDAFLGEGSWSRVGIVLDIPADEVQTGIPLAVTMHGPEGRLIEFGPLYADGAFDQYDTKAPVFAWMPLNDTL